jgi:uncharacterized membrane protein YraQ (UPF0718 family)
LGSLSPTENPLVIFSTIIAFQGQAPLLNTRLRIGFGYFIAVMIGLIVSSLQSESILRKGIPRRAAVSLRAWRGHGVIKSNWRSLLAELAMIRRGHADDFRSVLFPGKDSSKRQRIYVLHTHPGSLPPSRSNDGITFRRSQNPFICLLAHFHGIHTVNDKGRYHS